MSLIMEAHSEHLCLRMIRLNADEMEEPLLHYMSYERLVNTYERYKSIGIVAEIAKRVFVETRILMTKVSTAQCMKPGREKRWKGSVRRRSLENFRLRGGIQWYSHAFRGMAIGLQN
ncbi:DUF3653 domain-containing protein [Encephalitozoon cuniculi]|uniref:Uncharacterized protein n=1 Tax=Encephalitozoon cuniculi TaxID=6035 RepID=M1JM63_ENCCN|nr:hypothetical protein ECU11_0080 [Encephalitozoon cuniculi]UYI26205.1 DUF3653 domain-containing protein [Encephalitozoon cuniculi]